MNRPDMRVVSTYLHADRMRLDASPASPGNVAIVGIGPTIEGVRPVLFGLPGDQLDALIEACAAFNSIMDRHEAAAREAETQGAA